MKLKEALDLVQSFHPIGIAAQDLRECLLLQLNHLNKKLEDQPKLINLLQSIEYPMLQSLIRVETNGAKIDAQMLSDYSDELAIKIEGLSKAAFKILISFFKLLNGLQI